MTTALTYLLIGAGSAFGGMLRHALNSCFTTGPAESFPWGIVTVNIIGCLLMGIAFAAIDRTPVKFFIMTGVLGGFTTFSAFSVITLELTQSGRWDLAAAYIATSVVGCLVAVTIGFYITTSVFGSTTTPS